MTQSSTESSVLRIGSRGSPLALVQAREVQSRLAKGCGLPAERIEIKIIRTTGDMIQDRPLAEAGGKGLFTKEIEEALLSGAIDLAVHSSKDMPTVLPAGLELSAFLPREDARDAFIGRTAKSFRDLPQGAVVGTASLPAVGYASFVAEHTSMGTGALVPLDFSHIPFQGGNADPNLNGPELVFVRMRSGESSSAGRKDMQRIANASDRLFATDKNAAGGSVEVLGVLRPVQIVNYRSIGSTPIFLAAGLALGAVLALGLTLASSVRRRRREFALLKTFGFTHRQLASTVACQATTTALIGVVVGLPLGVVIGRQLWTIFARSIYAVPDPTVPLLSVIMVGVGTVLFANLVAVLPGRNAARTPAALALRTE